MISSSNDLDSDTLTYQNAIKALTWADVEYRLAPPEEQLKLWEPLQQAWDKYLQARITLLEPGIICNAQDVAEMKQIQTEVCQAGQTQALIRGLIKLAQALARFC